MLEYLVELTAAQSGAWSPFGSGPLGASEGSGFTLLFEAFVMLLAKQMPVAAISELVGEEDTRLWRLIARVVNEAHAAADWSAVSSLAILSKYDSLNGVS